VFDVFQVEKIKKRIVNDLTVKDLKGVVPLETKKVFCYDGMHYISE